MGVGENEDGYVRANIEQHLASVEEEELEETHDIELAGFRKHTQDSS